MTNAPMMIPVINKKASRKDNNDQFQVLYIKEPNSTLEFRKNKWGK